MTRSTWPFAGLKSALAAALALSLVACGGSDSAVEEEPPPPLPEREVSLQGSLRTPATFTLTDLKALPNVTQTVTYSASGSSTTRTFVGAGLWSMIETAGVEVNPERRNDIHNHYVIARAGDGHRAVFSLGELNPNFGNRGNLVAWGEVVNGQTVGLDGDGLLRVTSPGDVRGGRYVSDLQTLTVRSSGSTVEGVGGGLSTEFAVSGAVTTAGTWDLAALEALVDEAAGDDALPLVERAVGNDVYRGVDLWTFLDKVVGLDFSHGFRIPSLPMYLVGTGSDGYKVVVSLGELDPGFGNHPAMIAWEIKLGGEETFQELDRNGFARLVLPNDQRNGRFVSNLIALEVFVAPEAD